MAHAATRSFTIITIIRVTSGAAEATADAVLITHRLMIYEKSKHTHWPASEYL